MKKIYTLTFHKANNYGALLQAYALQKIIEKKYPTEILNYDNKSISNDYRLIKPFKGDIKNNFVQIIKDLINSKKEYLRIKNFNKFRKSIRISEKFNSINDISSSKYDDCIFITGSDQVWNPNITNGIDPMYTLNFDNNTIKKISYAASSGHNDTIQDCKNDLVKIIKKYNHISVREESLKILLSKMIPNTEIVSTLDPSLLLSKEDWDIIAGSKRLIKEKYIFVYCGEEPDYFYDIVNKIALENDYLIVYFGRRDRKHKFKGRKKSCYEYGPKEFVNLAKYSECIITVSFHGTALACIFNKNMFIVLNRYPDRLKSLLEKIGLKERIITSFDDFEKVEKNKIDWEKTNALIQIEKNKSINWLYNAIEK